MNLLFVCSRNRLRSPTAEAVFSAIGGVEAPATHQAASAGTSPDAEQPVDPEQLEWADLIFVMEARHKRILTQRFGRTLRGKRIVVLGIPDEFEFMQPELVELLEARVRPHLR